MDKILNLGFLEYSVSNDLIIIFPQAKYHFYYNQKSCWDVHGKMNPKHHDFMIKNGIQPTFIKNLIDRATSPIDKN